MTMGKKSLHLYQGWPTFFFKPPILFKPSSYPLHKRKTSKFHSVVQWLKHRTDDQHGLGSKPTCAILLCCWERHFMALSPAWWS